MASHSTLQINNLAVRRSDSHRNVSRILSTLLSVNNGGELQMEDQNNLFVGRKEAITHNSETSNL